MAKVAVLIGSKSDDAKMRPCCEILQELGIEHVFTITSAHRSPERTERLVRELEESGCQIFICAAGMAAHLAGAVAARTIRPVLGVPIASGALGGLDALLSTVQMPPGFPVGTLAIDTAGAKNAAWMAAQILALHDPDLASRLNGSRRKFAQIVEQSAKEL